MQLAREGEQLKIVQIVQTCDKKSSKPEQSEVIKWVI